MRVLHAVQLYDPVATGASRYFVEIGERLAAEGHEVVVVATDAYDLEHLWAPGKRRVTPLREQKRGVQIVRLPVRRAPGPPIVYPILRRLMVELSRVPGSEPILRRMAMLTPQLPDLAAFLRSTARFDLAHATNVTLDFMVLPAFDYARRSGAAFLCTPLLHLGVPGDQSVLRYYSMRHQIELLRHSDAVITMTGIEARYLAHHGVARERLHAIGAGVSPAELAGGDAARFRTEQHIDGPLVVTIGAMARDKGTIDVVEAMRQLWSQGITATLALIGAPLEHFSSYVAQLPQAVRDRIRLLPYAPEQAKRDALAAADVFALPSRTDSFGIVYLEAWCYGVPVIGARAGGVPDVISDGNDGLLVDFGNPAALAEAVGRLLRDRALGERLGAAGRAKVLRDYTWERQYERVRAVYLLTAARVNLTQSQRILMNKQSLDSA